MKLRTFALVLVCVTPATALAEPAIDVGARIGGYGFRESADAQAMSDSLTGWQACRMNGIGVFASRALSRHFFLEGGFDTYFADSFPTGGTSGGYQTPIDRVSALMTMAIGARLFPESVVSPYLQVGVGGELTRVRLPELGLEDTAVLPFGFFGIGGVVRLSPQLQLGMVLRVNAMGYYDDDQFQTELDAQAELATQAQFFASYRL